ncbi:MAG: alpha-2-macroglobulin family protein [Chloroflexota bacterium]
MKRSWLYCISALLLTALVLPFSAGCHPAQAAEGYVVCVPRTMHSNSLEAVSFSLYGSDGPVRDRVEVTVEQAGSQVARGTGTIDGKGAIEVEVPELDDGDYTVVVKGTGFEQRAEVRIENPLVVFLETDKPIYKPGQTINMRVMTFDSQLLPVDEDVTIEVLDAKGIKVFRSEVQTDEYGMASLELPLSSEPNLGTWKLSAEAGDASTQLDVRVERYVLPKYDITVDLPREWFLVSERIEGSISSEYSFGKPVKGTVEIAASRYVGEWEEYATFTGDIDGSGEFELPAVGYVAGVPGAGGQGNVMLDITVSEDVTGYVERTSRLLMVADSSVNLQLIPEGSAFKPGLPFSFLFVTETPDNRPIDERVRYEVTYLDEDFGDIDSDSGHLNTTNGTGLLEISPSNDAVALSIRADAEGAHAERQLQASYSPSGNFIHVEQVSDGVPQAGDEVEFRVHSTSEARTFYYEVVSRGRIVFSSYTRDNEFSFQTMPQMAPNSRLLVYQVLPNSEVAADYIPFDVVGAYPHRVGVMFGEEEAEPGDDVEIRVTTEGRARVGLAAVDKSVFILAENRLNLQQVFAELERLYMEPRAELHDVSIYPIIETRGAADVFDDAGVVVLSNHNVPEGKQYESENGKGFWEGLFPGMGSDGAMVEEAMDDAGAMPPAAQGPEANGEGLVELERVRQYFPETWIWEELETGNNGRASLDVTVPDTITTWMLRAVGISREFGLGIAEAQLVAFQPFFLTLDLPYSAIRGEEFPVSVSIYNYVDSSQDIRVEIEEADWFDLLDDAVKTVEVGPNNLGSVEFTIRPTELGTNAVEVKAQGQRAADALSKPIIIEPEGVSRETVDNLVLSDGDTHSIDSTIPPMAVEDSGRAFLALTSSFLTQTMEGLEELIQMPSGCGEQNMMLFAPDVYITRYLEESGQLKPEILAKAEKLMITGYQRELTYRRSDGSFSAFGQSDNEGSLWLTAFVLKSFSEAQGLIYIDETVLREAEEWIVSHQNGDGSFDQVGFVHHQEMLGGLQGKDALTAYVAVALMEAGETSASADAIDYLEAQLSGMTDAYTVALTSYALALADSPESDDAMERVMGLAQEDEKGLYWGGQVNPLEQGTDLDIMPRQENSATIETTGYATMALMLHGDTFNASRAARWLTGQRNSYGGFGSTQDTVVGIQALVEYQTGARADVDMDIIVSGEDFEKKVRITPENFDVLQIISLPVDGEYELTVDGDGKAVGQVVRRFNLPDAQTGTTEILAIEVDYDTTEVEVDDTITVSATLTFNPPQPAEAGMIVMDISIPTGFTAVAGTLEKAVERDQRLKRYEVAGRKVIFYIENLHQGESVSLEFDARALYPVKGKGVSSRAYAYYSPELGDETLGPGVTVS